MKCPSCKSVKHQRWFQLTDPDLKFFIDALMCIKCKKIIAQKKGRKVIKKAEQKEMFI